LLLSNGFPTVVVSGTVASAVNTASTPQTFAALLDMSREDVQLDAARLLGRLAASGDLKLSPFVDLNR
tara:strand:- start:387 stop:590 length:204 start_codon:yes stop_codon:yes gene_type:complete